MKKIYLILPLSFVFIGSTAQDNYLAVKGGINFATIMREKGMEFESVTGYHGGLQFNRPFNEFFSLQAEMLYSREGYVYLEERAAFHNVNVPLLLKIRPEQAIHFVIGMQASVLAAKKDPRPYSLHKTLNGAMVFGAGFSIGKYVEVEGRMNLGLTNVYKKHPLAEIKDRKAFGKIWQLGLAYKIFGNR